MSFEFFFGLFGLISSDTKSRHKSRVDNDWRLFTPLDASLFKGASDKNSFDSTGSKGNSAGRAGPLDSQKSVFSTSGALLGGSGAPSGNLPEGMFSSASSTSISSIGSTASKSTVNSSAGLINNNAAGSLRANGGSPEPNKASVLGSLATGKKYEFAGERENATAPDSSSGAGLELGAANEGFSKRVRAIYCRCVCLLLWFNVIRLLVGLAVEKSLLTLDFYYLGANRIHFLIPAVCLAIQAAAVSLIFIRNNDETNWLVPFYSSKDYLIRSRSNFRPKIEDYTRRINISVGLVLVLALLSSYSISAYLVQCIFQAQAMKFAGDFFEELSTERVLLSLYLVFDILWAIYSTYICFLVSFFFNLICSIMKSRFRGISKIIEDLAESNTRKTTSQARKITTLYLEHNEACELLDESNDFWQYLIFFTYFTYIPAYCYCLYNLFFVDFEPWPSFITWVIHTHMGFIILLISFSAAGVSTEAHAPYTSLHTLSLIQLPLDVEVNITTFLHRVRGLTIGYSCYDLFAITNASMSNTAAACASYFLIVADFSRSSVFTLAQANGTAAAAAAAASGATPAVAATGAATAAVTAASAVVTGAPS